MKNKNEDKKEEIECEICGANMEWNDNEKIFICYKCGEKIKKGEKSNFKYKRKSIK